MLQVGELVSTVFFACLIDTGEQNREINSLTEGFFLMFYAFDPYKYPKKLVSSYWFSSVSSET